MSGDRGNGQLNKLLAAWEAGAGKTVEETAKAFEALDVCGGALLFLTRAEARKLIANGVGLDRDPEVVIPEEGRGSIRVRCRAPGMSKQVSEEIPGTERKQTRTVHYGLCVRCAGWEAGLRTKLRKEAKEAELAARTGARKRGFRESSE